MMMMPMHFFFSDKVILLFDFWDVHSAGGMVLSVFIIMLLTVLYEGIKVGKLKLIQHSQMTVAPSISQENLREGISVNSEVGSATSSLKKERNNEKSRQRDDRFASKAQKIASLLSTRLGLKKGSADCWREQQ